MTRSTVAGDDQRDRWPRGLRWRRCQPSEAETIAARLAEWPCAVGGAVRHMFALATLESRGPDMLRVASVGRGPADDGTGWAAAVVLPGRLLVPCGDPEVVAAAGQPSRRWRLLVGDAACAGALLDTPERDPGLIVHVQRFLTVDHDEVPSAASVPDPGLRRAESADVGRLAELAVQLHVDDRFGPHPGRSGLRGYRNRLEQTVTQGLVWCVGPVGAPVAKLERSVSSPRYGVQLAGIVVDPAHRGGGLGTAVVAAAVRGATGEAVSPHRPDAGGRPISLHVRAENVAALAAYARAGFVDREPWRLAVRG